MRLKATIFARERDSGHRHQLSSRAGDDDMVPIGPQAWIESRITGLAALTIRLAVKRMVRTSRGRLPTNFQSVVGNQAERLGKRPDVLTKVARGNRLIR